MATVTSVYKFLCNCVYGHALSCTERSVQACTETHLEFEVVNKDDEKIKAGYLQSVALDFKLLGVGPELWTLFTPKSDRFHIPPAASPKM